MTILWIYNMPLVPEAGGTERITSLVAKGLEAKGHRCLNILVFNESDGKVTYDGTPVDDVYEFLKVNTVDIVINQIAYAKWLLESFLDKGGRRWRKEGGRIISCLHFDPKPTTDLYYFLSKRNKGIIDYLNIVKSVILRRYLESRQQKKTGNTFNWIYDNSDWFVTLSPTHFAYIKKVMGRNEYDRLMAINNPLTFDKIADKSVIEEKKKIVLVCSRMDEYQKRISIMLKAWEKLQRHPESEGWTLKILGTGPDLERYRSFVRSHHIENIIFEGRQSPEPYYREADIFLMTSVGIEGWGLTLTESLQCGVVPVVMNTCPVYSEIITHGYNGYLTEGSEIKSFTKHILTLMADGQHLRDMQLNALQSAHRFTLEKTMEKWDKLIQDHQYPSTLS